MKKSQNALVRAHQLCTGASALHPRPIFIRSLAELLGFDFLRKSRKILSFGAVNFYPHIIASRQIGQVHKKINRERDREREIDREIER